MVNLNRTYIKRYSLVLTIGVITTGCAEPIPHVGQQVWEENCRVCHSVGLAGSPIFGDEKAWAPRIERGMPSLYQHALEGWGDMPARGGNPELTDEQVKNAVNYMVEQITQ